MQLYESISPVQVPPFKQGFGWQRSKEQNEDLYLTAVKLGGGCKMTSIFYIIVTSKYSVVIEIYISGLHFARNSLFMMLLESK